MGNTISVYCDSKNLFKLTTSSTIQCSLSIQSNDEDQWLVSISATNPMTVYQLTGINCRSSYCNQT